jgi:hypothetical protein
VCAKAREAFRVERVETARARLRVEHQADVFEYPEVLRNGGTRDGESLGDLVDGHWPFGKALEDGHAGAVGESIEAGL